jgi:hypothetical protein
LSRLPREDYVRPPVLAREPTPRWVDRWRFRLVAIVITLLLAYMVFAIARHFVQTEQNPTFGVGLGALSVSAFG